MKSFIYFYLIIICYQCYDTPIISKLKPQVECLKGIDGKAPQFDTVTSWPKCNKKELPKCDDFPDPPDGVPIGLADKTPVLPGASVFYKCTGFGQISNLGEDIEV